jgi:hypothetical protein
MEMRPEEKGRYDRIDRQLEFLAGHGAQLSSEDRLNAFINIVERHYSNGRHDQGRGLRGARGRARINDKEFVRDAE